MAPLISVIIPNRDGEAVLGPCLEALAAQSLTPGEVMVVDDASTDGSRELVRSRFPEVRLIELEQSRGFAGANAAGLAESKGEWVATLNNDTEASPQWLEQMARAAETDQHAAMIGSRVVLAQPEGVVDSVGLGVSRGGLAFLECHQCRDEPVASDPFEIFGPAGSAAMYRRDLIEEVGWFEPDYFIYYEDLDLDLRARWRGYVALTAPGARVIHRHSYTMDRMSRDKRLLLQRNRLRTLVRNWPVSWLARCAPWLAGAGAAGALRALMEGQPLTPLLARTGLLPPIKGDLAMRRAPFASAKVDPHELFAWIGRRAGSGS